MIQAFTTVSWVSKYLDMTLFFFLFLFFKMIYLFIYLLLALLQDLQQLVDLMCAFSFVFSHWNLSSTVKSLAIYLPWEYLGLLL